MSKKEPKTFGDLLDGTEVTMTLYTKKVHNFASLRDKNNKEHF